ncbi:MAG TPA: hypothetical protein IAD28_01035 [Candidatus Faeciplasma avium]|uniref:Uncharacterized protein n=1 Tax=Candidatus Faeciplasma avium TaxID=2840798 RepID=A0A9D1NQF8_9FIRM|nr:hypothetical protein [Candidatus Faeciplasma avium]
MYLLMSELTITKVCRHIKNYFERDSIEGDLVISQGTLSCGDRLPEGCYYRILGSLHNDGVHLHPAQGLTDESFSGSVRIMAPPEDFLSLVLEIEEYEASKNGSAEGFVSESFGGYSYKKATSGGRPLGWRQIFKSRLDDFRKI